MVVDDMAALWIIVVCVLQNSTVDAESKKEYRVRHYSGQKKFHPVLEPLLEVVEATA